jgi:prepilin-type N-terminal cleavage/methylation domain-containing protein
MKLSRKPCVEARDEAKRVVARRGGSCGEFNAGSGRCDGRAFTLVEIMIVVGILAIVVAMGMPAFVQTLKKEPLRQAVSDIVDACTQARAQAILKGAPAELTIRAADGQLTVAPVRKNAVAGEEGTLEPTVESGDATAPATPMFSARLQEDIAVTLLYVNLQDRMEAEETRVRFYPNGTSDEFTIVVQFGGGIRKISLECVTGLADVEVVR